jgi:hypothetical protein
LICWGMSFIVSSLLCFWSNDMGNEFGKFMQSGILFSHFLLWFYHLKNLRVWKIYNLWRSVVASSNYQVNSFSSLRTLLWQGYSWWWTFFKQIIIPSNWWAFPRL